MIAYTILGIGFLLGAVLHILTDDAPWFAYAGMSVTFFVIAAVYGDISQMGTVMMIGSAPIAMIGVSLGGFAKLFKSTSSAGTYAKAMKGALTFVIIAVALLTVGALLTLIGGAK